MAPRAPPTRLARINYSWFSANVFRKLTEIFTSKGRAYGLIIESWLLLGWLRNIVPFYGILTFNFRVFRDSRRFGWSQCFHIYCQAVQDDCVTRELTAIKFWMSWANRPALQRNISEYLNLPQIPSDSLKSPNLNVHYPIHNSSVMDSALGQMAATHNLISSVFNLILHSHLRLGLPSGLFPLGFFHKICVIFSSLAYVLCVFLSYTLLACDCSY